MNSLTTLILRPARGTLGLHQTQTQLPDAGDVSNLFGEDIMFAVPVADVWLHFRDVQQGPGWLVISFDVCSAYWLCL